MDEMMFGVLILAMLFASIMLPGFFYADTMSNLSDLRICSFNLELAIQGHATLEQIRPNIEAHCPPEAISQLYGTV